MNYKQYIIKKGDNELGLLWSDIQLHLLTPTQFKQFKDFMGGQTMSIIIGIIGREYISIVYTGDFEKFLRINKIQ